MKALEVTDTGLIDIMQVAKTLADDEIEQILAFGGNPHFEAVAMSLIQSAQILYTVREAATEEPLVVMGLVQCGAVVYRTVYLANPRVWKEHAKELTELTKNMLEDHLDKSQCMRVETMCLSKRKRARTWYEKQVGLKFDGELECYGVNGEDVALYSMHKKPTVIQQPNLEVVRMN